MKETKNIRKTLSVLISVYNDEEYIYGALSSIFNQDRPPDEIVIVDDCSTDNSLAEINKFIIFVKPFNLKIKLVKNPENQGLTKSLNIGLKHITSDYIARQDADDISLPNRFSIFFEFLEHNNNLQFYSTPYLNYDTNGLVRRPRALRRMGFDKEMLNYHNPLCHGTLIIKSSILKEYLYNEKYTFSQDYELYRRLISNGYLISYDYVFTYFDRDHEKRISRKKSKEQTNDFNRIQGQKIKIGSKLSSLIFLYLDILFLIKKIFKLK